MIMKNSNSQQNPNLDSEQQESKPTLLLVDDEEKIIEVLEAYLKKEGFSVFSCSNGEEALKIFDNNKIDLILLDLMLPDLSGEEVCKVIRAKSCVPIIMITAKTEEEDLLEGFDIGADDYVTKPYSPKELVLRVNNIIKRVYTKVTTKTYYETYEIDTERRIILENNQEIPLTTLEYDLVLFFINNKNKSFGREEILKNVWGTDYFGNDRVVDDLIRRVRKKLPKLNINTLYGFGYRLS